MEGSKKSTQNNHSRNNSGSQQESREVVKVPKTFKDDSGKELQVKDGEKKEPLIKENNQGEECDSSKMCVVENKLVACLRVPGNGIHACLLLLPLRPLWHPTTPTIVSFFFFSISFLMQSLYKKKMQLLTSSYVIKLLRFGDYNIIVERFWLNNNDRNHRILVDVMKRRGNETFPYQALGRKIPLND